MTPLRTSALVLLLLSAAAIPFAVAQDVDASPGPGAATDPSAQEAGGLPVKFGMDSASVAAQKAAGVPADYGTFWIGPWTLTSGWAGPDGQLVAMKNAGVTPAIHFYYWGDDITPSCVENGCWSSLHDAQKTRAGWETLGTQLTDHLTAKMGGAPVVVFLESEFNKGGIQSYEPFDGYMADMAAKIHAGYPAAIVVLGFGNWGSNYWGNFDRAAAASDMVGIQGMRGSTRQSLSDMYTLYDGLLSGVKSLEAKFPGKPIMLTDIAVSSHPEPDYLKVQAEVLGEVFANLPTLKSHGVEAMIYRSWKDSPNMDLANYYGEAERHWGLAWASSGAQKPSAQVWVDGVKAERAGGSAPPTPPPAPTPPAPLDATFTPTKNQNEWWVEVSVAANNPLALVEASVDGGAAQALPKTSWGSYAKSIHAPRGSMVTFTATDTAGQKDSSEPVQWIGAPPPPPQAPVAAFTATMSGLEGAFDASASSDADSAQLTYAWDFGDGATAAGIQAQHAFAAGTHTVTLTVSDGALSHQASQQVTAVQPNRAPAPSFTAAATYLAASFDAAASADADGDALQFAWDLGDGTTATGAQASRTYANAGTYTVTLTVSDGKESASASKAVTVTAPPPPPPPPAPTPSPAPTPAPAPQPAAKEGEAFATRTTGGALTDAKASGGKAWNLWSKGEMRQSFTLQAGEYDLTVRAKGTPASGVAPHMDVYLGGVKVLSADPGTSYADHKVRVKATGTTELRLVYTNDVRTTKEDRNLIVDKATFTPVAAPAMTATVTPKAVGNDWWVEAAVSASEQVAKVDARVNGGAWVQLEKQSWGNYAQSMKAPDGAKVEFRVTGVSGATVVKAFTW